MKQYIYKLIAIAGTFDRLHKGHRFFISEAFALGEKVIIGLTSDRYVQENSKIKDQRSKLQIKIQKYQKRKEELTAYLKKEKLFSRAQTVMIDDVYGPAAEKVSPPLLAIAHSERRRASSKATARLCEIEALVVTKETLPGAKLVNKRRKERGLKPLKIIQVPMIIAEDKKPISSTRIRRREIDSKGNRIENFTGRISENLRQELKKPMGILLPDSLLNHGRRAEKLKKLIRKIRPIYISTVGDEATKLCNEVSIAMNLAVVDYKVNRKKVHKSLSDLGFTKRSFKQKLMKPDITVRNPPGNITGPLVAAIKKAYETAKTSFPFIIRVLGEEDLSGVPAILLAPLGAVVLYGQPGEGIVVVTVTEKKKKDIRHLIKNRR